MFLDVGEYCGTDVIHAINNNLVNIEYIGRMCRKYRALARCSATDAEPRFDGVDWSDWSCDSGPLEGLLLSGVVGRWGKSE
jgi:hypothetical protein